MNNITVCEINYEISSDTNNVLEALIEIKKYTNNTLAFKYGCKSGVCGSCTVYTTPICQDNYL